MKRVALVLALLLACGLAQSVSAKLVHRWSFAADAKDSVGTANAQLQDGMAVKDGKVALDGQGGWLGLPIGGTLAKLKSATFETWLTWDERQGAWCRVFDFGTGQAANMFFTPRNGNAPDGGSADTPRFAITTNGFQEEEQLNPTEPFPVGKLTHLAITIDADKHVGKMYINGKEVASSDMTLTPSSVGNTTVNYLGASEYETDPLFHGSVSEFRIYDTALSAEEVAANEKLGPDQLPGGAAAAPAMTAVPPKPADTSKPATPAAAGGLVHRWSFATDLSDSVGKANGELKDGATIADGRLVLDGQKGYATLPIGDTMEKLTNSTFETWVKWDERQRAWLRLFDFGVRGGKSMYVTPRNGGGRGAPRDTLRFTITVNGDPGEELANSQDQFPVGEETHVAVTIDADKHVAKLYVNGKLAATHEELTLTPSSLGNTVNNFIGKSQFRDPFFKGSFDEFRIYSKTLSPEEVEASFKAGPDKVAQ